MSATTFLTVDDYPLFTNNNHVFPDLMTVFQETDRQKFSRRSSARNRLVFAPCDSAEEEDFEETAVLYSSDAKTVAARLDIMGFTLDRVSADFAAATKMRLESLKEWQQEGEDSIYVEEVKLLETLTFDAYRDALAGVIKSKKTSHDFSTSAQMELDPVSRHILFSSEEPTNYDDYIFLGFPNGCDIRGLLRLACDIVSDCALVVQDITELIDWGTYDEDEPVAAICFKSLSTQTDACAPRIVLAEGRSDIEFLQNALQLLYPHLTDFYSFLDFREFNIDGGASKLVAFVKAFAGAGITNKVIAVFDNDTAGEKERRILERVNLPDNIAVLSYPDFSFLENYPTMGPTGLQNLNVNGKAASIELYFGEDVLRENGELTPVQWKGYDEKMNRYQGAVMRKSELHKRFRNKIDECQIDESKIASKDWEGIKLILDLIFRAFSSAVR